MQVLYRHKTALLSLWVLQFKRGGNGSFLSPWLLDGSIATLNATCGSSRSTLPLGRESSSECPQAPARTAAPTARMASRNETDPSTNGDHPHGKVVPEGTHAPCQEPHTIPTRSVGGRGAREGAAARPAAAGCWGARRAAAGMLQRARPEHSSQMSFLGNKAFPFNS